MAYPLLDRVNSPQDLRQLTPEQLAPLCKELRTFLQANTLTKAGHIKSSLGVTELSVALHYVLDTPQDILIWDVGHQAYVHKIITSRKEQFHTNRQKGGITGFTNRQESAFDPFGAGHSSTSISAVAGFWKASQLQGLNRQHVAVIGDGALTGGMAFEALNYLGEQKANCLIILNDNQSSIDANVGALQSLNSYKGFAESLGFAYQEVSDGNQVQNLVSSLQGLKQSPGPKFLKISTQKGLGYQVPPIKTSTEARASFQSVFADKIFEVLTHDPKVVVLSPAMLSGAHLQKVRDSFPQRVIDVGIAEQHVVTMAAGLAANGFYPIIHLYSTFAQRALDQIIHDVVLQKLPALFCLDRAGLVGADGPTHHGVFDVSLLSSLPKLALFAPATAVNLNLQIDYCVKHQTLAALRYPKDEIYFQKAPLEPDILEPHWWKNGIQKCVVSYGSLAAEAQKAITQSSFAHLNVPQLKPFPAETLQKLLAPFEQIVSVEENMAEGGLGAQLSTLKATGRLKAKHRALTLPAKFVAHGTRSELLADCGLHAQGIAQALQLD